MSDYPSKIFYKLSLLQVIANPIGSLIGRFLSAIFVSWSIFLAALNNDQIDAGFLLMFIAMMTSAVFWGPVFFGLGKWTRNVLWLEFNSKGLATNYGNQKLVSEKEHYPYLFLTTEIGVLKTVVIKSQSGHFVIVPTDAVSKEFLDQIINRAKVPKLA